MKKPSLTPVWLFLGVVVLALICVSCVVSAPMPPTATPDYVVLETEVAIKLAATLTAKAPPTATWTPTPSPIPVTSTPTVTPSPTTTPEPTLVFTRSVIAYVRVMQDESSNIILSDPQRQQEVVLTHFVEPLNMCQVTWSKDGEWLVFVSAHDYMHSRDNERNVFIMRPDGSELRMVTGEHVDPDEAPGPYATLRGQVVGSESSCRVCAQGAAGPVTTDESGAFELPGVPLSAKWARAVCRGDETAVQGDVDLVSVGETLAPITITVQPQGQGWIQASLSRDNRVIGGSRYRWELDEEGVRQYRVEGVLQDLEGVSSMQLELLPDTSFDGLDWSPVADQLVGVVTGEDATWLWLWDATGRSMGQLVEMPNPERLILSAKSPVWSPDGSKVVFALHQWDWWGENEQKTELMVVSATADDEPRSLVTTDWGTHAGHASWTADGTRVYYQLSKGEQGEYICGGNQSDIWSVAVMGESEPKAWVEDGVSYSPAARPLPHPNAED